MSITKRSLLGILCVLLTVAGIANAKEDYGLDCGQCHDNRSGTMAVAGHDTTLNLGSGALKTFVAAPGETVALTMSVLSSGAVQLIGLDGGGRQNSSSNHLSYTADSTWDKYTSGGLYYTKSASGGSTATFNLTLNASTPPDVYLLTFGNGGKGNGKWYQTEDFYLQVVDNTPAPDPDRVISGIVRASDGTALSGVLLSGANAGSATTNAAGAYSITVPSGFSGTITATKADYTFDPISTSYNNLTLDLSGENYTGTPVVVTPTTVTISGNVTASGGAGINSVSVSANNNGGSAITDNAGFYSITVPYGWSGAVTLSKTGYTFEPTSGSYTNLTADTTNEDYVGTPEVIPPSAVTISGAVRLADGTAVSGVTVSTDGGAVSTVTDAAGAYSLIVPVDFSGTVTPAKADYTFEPASMSYTAVTADAANEDYVATASTVYSISAHVFSAEFQQAYDYNVASIPDDTEYIFYLMIETDDTITGVLVNAPGGNTFQIPTDAYVQLAGVETWHNVTAGNQLWAYQATHADAAELGGYGDGTYTITVTHANGQAQTEIVLAAPQTTDSVAQPIQEPVLIAPAYNEQTPSPVTLEWSPYTEALASAIRTELTGAYAGVVTNSYTANATSSEPITLGKGLWQVRLSFENNHTYDNADGIPVTVARYSESDSAIDVQADPAGGGDTPTGSGSEIVVDNNAAAATATGTWKISGGKNPHESDSRWTRDVDAAYTFGADLAADSYAVYLWWTEWPNRTTNVPVEIYNGDVLLETITVDQMTGGGQWNLLGIYDFTGPASVKVISNGGGTTNADAVRFLPADEARLEGHILDNGAPGTSSKGTWKRSSGKNPYGNNSRWSRDSNATYTFESPYAGTINVYAHWTFWPTRMSSVPVEIRDGDLLLDTVYINQLENGNQWNLLGTWDFSDHAVVTFVSEGHGSTNADAVKFDTSGAVVEQPKHATEIVIDNGSPRTSAAGAWKFSGGTNPYGRNSLYSRAAGDTYTFALQQQGAYEVQMRWTLWSNRVADVPVEIYDGDNLLDTVYVDQQINGSQFNSLGTYTFTQGAEVTILSLGPGSTCADAVKFIKTDAVTGSGGGDDNVTDPGPIDPDPGQGGDVDEITVSKSDYKVEGRDLRIRATSSDQPNAVLTVEGYGEMTFDVDANWYELRLRPVDEPGDTLTITSSSGGSITVVVNLK